MNANALAGTGTLVRLALRRDRVRLPVWIGALVLTAASSAAATANLYPDVASRARVAESINRTPSLVALYGRVYDPTSLGAVATIKLVGFGTAAVAALAVLTVVRHTRAEEEAGRAELLGAAAVGRLAPLTAALAVAVATDVVIGVLTAAGLAAGGLPGRGALVFGMAWACAGIAFAGVAACIAQLTTTARAATGVSLTVLGVSYLVRAVGDSSDGVRWVAWLSPLGLSQQVRAFAGDHWPVGLLLLGFAVTAGVVAYTLVERRDLGAGLLTDRPGRSAAPAWLRSPLALAWRLDRFAVLGWLAVFFVLGLVFGSVAANIGDLLDTPSAADLIRRLGGPHVLTDAYLAAELGFVAVFAAVYAVAAASRLHREEDDLRAEAVLATATSRARWMAGHATVAFLGSAAMLVASGVGAGLAHAWRSGEGQQVWRVLGASVAHAPAVWVFVGIALAAFGIARVSTPVAWAALAGAFLLGELGPMFELDQRFLDLSPFAHVPKLPGATLDVFPLAVLLGIAAVLTAVGFSTFARRDVG